MPTWALLVMALMQEAPALAAMIDLANAPETTPEVMGQLMAARDKAISDYEAAIGKPA